MDHNESISLIAQVIQLAVAPVFLLAGIGALLSMLTIRLGRIVDRARLLESQIPNLPPAEAAELESEAGTAWRRIGLIYWAIRLAVGSALLICLVVICLFIGDLANVSLGTAIAVLFIGAMTLICAALLYLLVEVSISTRRMRQRLEHHLGRN